MVTQGSYQPNNMLPQPNFLQQAMQSLYSPQGLDSNGPRPGALPGLPSPPTPGGAPQQQSMKPGVQAILSLFKPKQQYSPSNTFLKVPVAEPYTGNGGGDDNG